MFTAAHAHRHVRRFTCGLCVSVFGAGALAAGASAASLSVTVPSKVKRGKSYTIQVRGSYKSSEVNTAYLISLIQFSSTPCKPSAQKENDWATATNAFIQFYLAPNSDPSKGDVGLFEHKSPFSRVDGFKAGDLGTRRVCSYLYPKHIKSSDATAPIARASAKYAVTK